jgi:hypothetical protein
MAWREGVDVLTTSRGGTVGEKTVEVDGRPEAPQSPEALIEEARQRARRRRLWVVAVLLLVAAAVTTCIELTSSGGTNEVAVTAPRQRTGKPHTTPTSTRNQASQLASNCTSGDQLYFANPSDGWYLVRSGMILATTDGGRHWSTSYAGARCVVGFDFVDSLHGWAELAGVGPGQYSSGPLMRTVDGGRTWTSAAEPKHAAFVQIDFVNASQGWAIGARLWQTSNGGLSWSTVPTPPDVEAVCGTSQRTWVGLGDGEVLYQVPSSAQWVPSLVPSQVPLPPVGRVWPPPPLVAPQLFCYGDAAWAVYLRYEGLPDGYYVPERTLDGVRWSAEPEQVGLFADEGGLTSPSDAWFSIASAEAEGMPGVLTTTDGGAVLQGHVVYPQSKWNYAGGLIDFVNAKQGVAVVWGTVNPNDAMSKGRLVATDDGGVTWHVVLNAVPGS